MVMAENDVLCADGWWDALYTDGQIPQEFYVVDFGKRYRVGGRAVEMYVDDFYGGGESDVLVSSPRTFGIWWHEQLSANPRKTDEIDVIFSETDGQVRADMNGDGKGQRGVDDTTFGKLVGALGVVDRRLSRKRSYL